MVQTVFASIWDPGSKALNFGILRGSEICANIYQGLKSRLIVKKRILFWKWNENIDFFSPACSPFCAWLTSIFTENTNYFWSWIDISEILNRVRFRTLAMRFSSFRVKSKASAGPGLLLKKGFNGTSFRADGDPMSRELSSLEFGWSWSFYYCFCGKITSFVYLQTSIISVKLQNIFKGLEIFTPVETRNLLSVWINVFSLVPSEKEITEVESTFFFLEQFSMLVFFGELDFRFWGSVNSDRVKMFLAGRPTLLHQSLVTSLVEKLFVNLMRLRKWNEAFDCKLSKVGFLMCFEDHYLHDESFE